MPKCKVRGCNNFTRYKNTKQLYCSMHLARLKRHGTLKLKIDSHELSRLHALEKLPHPVVDEYIIKNCKTKIDKEIAGELRKLGFKNTTQWNVKYRRRQLGIKKYFHGEVQKHKEWIRRQAIKRYGDKCEICNYSLAVEVHHIIPKKGGGLHKIDNLMILCPNCHRLVTQGIIRLRDRTELNKARRELKRLL